MKSQFQGWTACILLVGLVVGCGQKSSGSTAADPDQKNGDGSKTSIKMCAKAKHALQMLDHDASNFEKGGIYAYYCTN